jgi:Domain of unknown function (DUF1707)
MVGRDEMRAGDKDRQAVADKLKEALDEGRLDLAEYDERLQKTYAAKTYGDLEGLLDDLPTPATPRAVAAPQGLPPLPESVRSQSGRLVKATMGGFGGVFVLTVIIWGITSMAAGHALYFWPVWLLIPLVLSVLGQLGEDRGNRRGRDRRGRRDR